MADDQKQVTGDREQVTTPPPPPPPPPKATARQSREPYYQDELDVLEAVLKLEKKYGKKFLTEEQREKLVGSGRVGGEGQAITMEESGKLEVTDGNVYGIKNHFFRGLIDDFGLYKEVKTTGTWKNMSARERSIIEDLVFRLQYGSFPSTFLYRLSSGMA